MQNATTTTTTMTIKATTVAWK